jgi:predicted ester cyclase
MADHGNIGPGELRALSRRYFEAWGGEDQNAEAEIVAADIVDHNAFVGFPQGIVGHRRRLELFQAAFSEWEHELVLQLAEGNLISHFWRAEGIHSGDLLGVPATGKRIWMTGVDVLRFEDGKLTDIWHQEDLLSVFLQLGVEPPAAALAEYLP